MIDDVPMCLSGGAEGADLMWGMCAGSAGHQVIHWGFKSHRSNAPSQEIVHLTQEQLDEADPYLIYANQTLGRHFPPKSQFVANLLRRNWYQVRDAQAIYAVASIVKGQVSGGTAWATQMFIDRFKGQPCEAYVFDQKTERWHKWNGSWDAYCEVLVPTGIWAGVGSRELLTSGKAAIRTLMGYNKQPT